MTFRKLETQKYFVLKIFLEKDSDANFSFFIIYFWASYPLENYNIFNKRRSKTQSLKK